MAAQRAPREGRGRGRGSSSHSVKPSAERQPKAPKTIEGVKDYLETLNEGNFGKYGDMFANMVLEFGSSEEKLKEAVALVFDITVESRDNAPLGGKVCSAIAIQSNPDEPASVASKRTLFLKHLLNRFQSEFGKKNNTRRTSIEYWLSIFSFLCEVFSRVKVKGEPVKVAGRAIILCMEWLLSEEDCIEDEVECICTYLRMFGKTLEQINNELIKSVVRHLRKKAISRDSSCKTRCMILEVLEYRAMGWEDRGNELDDFYLDAIADAAAEDDLHQMK